MSAAEKKTCFVVMGFQTKPDYRTGRTIDLDKTYNYIIKPAVEAAGLECIRADEIPHSGPIEVPMYQMLLEADLVVADLSTSNVNAAYELGVRHALKPHTTIIIAEDQFDFPFDVKSILIRTFRHEGKALDIEEVERFRPELQAAIEELIGAEKIDSPVYTFLGGLNPPERDEDESALEATTRGLAPATRSLAPADESLPLAVLVDQANEAKKNENFVEAKSKFKAALKSSPNDVYLTQQLALATFKSKEPDEASALEQAREILSELAPMRSSDAETLGLWGAIHKRFWDADGDPEQLDVAIAAYEKGYRLLNDYYNGINYAFLLNVRSANTDAPEEAITDFVIARRARKNVMKLCDEALEKLAKQTDDEDLAEEKYWAMATKAEAAFGLGRSDDAKKLLEEVTPAPQDWMLATTQKQFKKLAKFMEDSPLKKIALE